MRIIVDAFGGDNAPVEIVKGCIEAKKEYGIDITLVGTKDLDKICNDNDLSLDGFDIEYANSVIDQNEPGTVVLREKKDSTMAVGLKMLADGKGDGFLSAGSSGAICAGATLIVKRIKGVKRPGFAPIMPNTDGFFMLMDAGANADCKPQYLLQFAQMGTIYMNKVMGIGNPRVGLANIGTEEHKGTELQQEAYKLLKESNLNFVGNVEAREIPQNACDVVVCDGFSGNMIVKTYEGVAMALLGQIKGIFKKNLKTKLAASMIMPELKEFKAKFDYNEFGGAPIIGCSKPVFKAHGNAKTSTFKSALRLTKEYIEQNVVEEISSSILNMKEDE